MDSEKALGRLYLQVLELVETNEQLRKIVADYQQAHSAVATELAEVKKQLYEALQTSTDIIEDDEYV